MAQTELQELVVQRQHSEHSELLERKAHLVKLEERLRLGPLAHLERRVLMALLARLVQREPPAVLLRSELMELMELPAVLLSSERMEPKAKERQEQLVRKEHLAQVALRRREESERLERPELRVRMGRPAGLEAREPKIVVARCLPRVGFHREDCRS